MQIVIYITEDDYNRIKEIPDAFESLTSRAYKAIKNGIPLPRDHGRLIDADEFSDIWKGAKINGTISVLIDARPTVIPAAKEDKE